MEYPFIAIAWSIWAIQTVILALLAIIALVRRERVDSREARDVLVLAAHSDDCVITAGEYAIDAIRAGRKVNIVYLTCGSEDPHDARSAVRKHEAIAAWSLAGLDARNLIFLDLPHSPIKGPPAYNPQTIEPAQTLLRQEVAHLPPGAAVFLPAAGESHCDHQELRCLALDIIQAANRPDLHVFEAAEYNKYCSLRQPHRVLKYISQLLPLLGQRLITSEEYSRAGFCTGLRGCIRPPDRERLALKQTLLRQFKSEDGAMLVKYFGFRDIYRQIENVAATARAPERHPFFFLMGNQFLSPMVLWMCLHVWSGIALLGATGIWMVAQHATSATTVIFAILTFVIMFILLLRARAVERKLNFVALACGVMIGICL